MIAFFTNRLNHHQVQVADELYKITNGDFAFVELCPPNSQSNKGSNADFSERAYLIQAWRSEENKVQAYKLAEESDVCVFGTIASLPFEKARMKKGLLSFDMGERWLKKGIKNVFSPAISKMILNYHLNGWRNKPLYRLCMSAYAAGDHNRLRMFRGKCFKWGYFTAVGNVGTDEILAFKTSTPVRLMWCARFLKLKHPEQPMQMAKKLKDKGYDFVLDFYGSGEELETTKQLAETLEVTDVVNFHGTVPNDEVLKAMREHDVFLFTSNRQEGWGAVVNEAMSNGCAVVGNDVIGSVPYLVKDGFTGLQYHETVDSLIEKVEWLLNHPDELRNMQRNAYNQMKDIWSPANAARSLIQLINDLNNGKESSIKEGPCSKAE